MQEIHSSNPPVVTGICDPNKSQARHYHNFLAIATNLQLCVRSAKTAKQAWDNLEKHFQQKPLCKKIFCRQKLYSARMVTDQNMTKHINYMKTLAEHLSAIDHEITEKGLVIILIGSLPEKYNHLITALKMIADDHLRWNYVRHRLIHENKNFRKLLMAIETMHYSS